VGPFFYKIPVTIVIIGYKLFLFFLESRVQSRVEKIYTERIRITLKRGKKDIVREEVLQAKPEPTTIFFY
jgi:hypothetical protein